VISIALLTAILVMTAAVSAIAGTKDDRVTRCNTSLVN